MKIQHLADLPWEAVSHNPAIRKRVVHRQGEVAHLCQFAQARFAPGQSAPAHAHADLVEIFLVTEGTATAVLDGHLHTLRAGSTLLVEAGEEHEIRNEADHDLVLTYFSLRAAVPTGPPDASRPGHSAPSPPPA